ncbi:MAG: hypothetical protein WBA09_22400 [Candidatus Acidiferrum sp.]
MLDLEQAVTLKNIYIGSYESNRDDSQTLYRRQRDLLELQQELTDVDALTDL